MEIPPVNENTTFIAPQYSMHRLGSVLPQLIESVAWDPVVDGNMLFSKLDINDGYWIMIVKKCRHLNFAYVLPDTDGAIIRLVIPLVLQMGWSKSPPLFLCSH